MGTKTTEETAGTPATDIDQADGTDTSLLKEDTAATESPEAAEDTDEDLLDDLTEDVTEGSSFVGQGAAAIVAAVLGLVSLTGGWIGTVAAARESVIGQLQSTTSTDVATLVKENYGDSWNTTAVYAGAFALFALLVAAVTLVRPAFGAPGPAQPAWIKSVAWAGLALGAIGLLLAVLKYTEILVGLPSTG
ncbi:hypothetical protein AB0D49_18940 [Streptomyces sp. NPDC048290]|uniref:hypothetical protein n=1 Tax=Streptomyces sp. NPDC048290 TaxID=3155811 RepID=UPI0034202F3D